jgi:ribosomal-protein-alanine N-acetyltransferase
VSSLLPRTPLLTARLLLRPYEPADAPAFAALLLANQARIRPSFPERVQAVQTPEGARATIENFRHDWRTGRFYVLGIWQRETDQYLGDICLLPHPPAGGEIGYYLAAEAEGHGYAREALEAVVGLGFETLDLTSLTIRCYVSNERAQAVARAIGFEEEVPPPKSFWFRMLNSSEGIRRFVLTRKR